MSNYEDMLQRLKMYRKKTNLLQNQIGEMLGLSQERYSYMETGDTKISYETVMNLNNIGLSVNFLVAGKEYDIETLDLDNALCNIKNQHQKDFLLKLVAEFMI